MAAGGFYSLRRYREVVERRLRGMKKEGEITVVVTDIEGYSGGCAAVITFASWKMVQPACTPFHLLLRCGHLSSRRLLVGLAHPSSPSKLSSDLPYF
jgi:hypothetical protein